LQLAAYTPLLCVSSSKWDICPKKVTTYFEVLSQHLHAGTEENQEALE
jgi:hypothetical protein